KVQTYLPIFPYKEISIRHLMNQTSGLPEYFDIAMRNMSLLDTLTNESMLELLAVKKIDLSFQPGEKFEYCNTNYTTLALIIEKVSGITTDKFLQKNIAEPLKLKNTFIYNLKMKSYPPARVFGFHMENGVPVSDDLLRLDGIVGDGNVYSSVEDLYTWDQALYSNKLVKQSTFQEAITGAKLNNGETTDYGFAWFIKTPGEVVSHSGGWVGFNTLIIRNIKLNQTFILLDNSGNYRATDIAGSIFQGKPVQIPQTHLIRNVRLIDGTGMPSRNASVRIVDDRINDIGDLEPRPDETVTEGNGLVLAPGFIDSHSHHDWGLEKHPDAIAATNQGITTIVVGQDGSSYPIDTITSRIKARPVSVNIATYTGHSTLRGAVMKQRLFRQAQQSEVDSMKTMLEREMNKGSLGLATGLEYESAFYSSRDEVIDLAKVAAAKGGRYISHIRSEDIYLNEALDEIIDIGREAKIPVQISHIKIAMRSKWESTPRVIAKLNRARLSGVDVTADVYPYAMWLSTPRVLFPKKDFTNLESAQFATRELFDPAASYIVNFSSDAGYEGKTVTEIGVMNNESPAHALMRVIHDTEQSNGDAAIAATSMSEKDIIAFLQWPNSNICSDGSLGGHPRGYGAFARVLGRYVRDQKILPLETAIYKMTGLTAEHVGITRRGIITRGYYADLVLFNPETVKDNATITNPDALSDGIEMVWVNGKVVYKDKKPIENYPGRFISRGN
ncbi:MAG: serine hydrolase, partial [Marivirga sp.]|nr:serine hydrolase [Marivirga sp.]